MSGVSKSKSYHQGSYQGVVVIKIFYSVICYVYEIYENTILSLNNIFIDMSRRSLAAGASVKCGQDSEIYDIVL